MAERLPDIDDLSIADLKQLLLEALAKLAELTAENAALREEIARLKGLKGRPRVKSSQPSGMEEATSPKRSSARGKRRGGRGWQARVAVEERVIEASPRVKPVTTRSPSPPRAPCGAASGRMVSSPRQPSSATTPDNSISAGMACAGCMPSSGRRSLRPPWFTGSTPTDQQQAAQQRLRALIWWLYGDRKAYQADPSPRRRAELRARFERIFKRQTGFATLDRLLARRHAKKPELLLVLDHPQIPLHTNGSENDIRCQVTRRKISGGTRSDLGRDCRDAFLGLAKTCTKLAIAFWDYLGDRLATPAHPEVPYLPGLVRHRCQSA